MVPETGFHYAHLLPVLILTISGLHCRTSITDASTMDTGRGGIPSHLFFADGGSRQPSAGGRFWAEGWRVAAATRGLSRTLDAFLSAGPTPCILTRHTLFAAGLAKHKAPGVIYWPGQLIWQPTASTHTVSLTYLPPRLDHLSPWFGTDAYSDTVLAKPSYASSRCWHITI